jgi:amino acid transporter
MDTPAEKHSPKLIRVLGPYTAIAIVVGTVIGSGVFKKPQVVAENVPYFGLGLSVWVLGGLLALLGSLTVAELAVLYPRAGGNYVFLREGYGRLFGFLWGWVDFWIIRGASLAALATIFTESFYDLLGLGAPTESAAFWTQRGVTVSVILCLALVNVRGVQWGGFLQLLITLVKIGSLVGIAVLPVVALFLASSDGTEPARPHLDYLQPVWPSSVSVFDAKFFGAYGTALVGVLFAYHGWMNIVPVAEEVKKPHRNLPLALLAGTVICVVLYLGANLAYYLVMPRADIAEMKETPVATGLCLRILGPMGAVLASGAVMMSVFGALNGNLLVGPRLLYAMGEDGLAPRTLAAVHARYRTPAFAILMTGAWASALILGGAALTRFHLPTLDLAGWQLDLNVKESKSLFNLLTDFAMFGSVTFETLAVTTIFVFRRRLPDAERPYRCVGYPVVPLLYVGIMSLVLINMFREQWTESLVGVWFIGMGAAVYVLFAPKAMAKEEEMVTTEV